MYDARRGGWGIGRNDGSGEYYVWDSEEHTRIPWSGNGKKLAEDKKTMNKENKNVGNIFEKVAKEEEKATRSSKQHRTLRQMQYDWRHPWECHRSLPDIISALRDSEELDILAGQWHEHLANVKSATQKFLVRHMRRSV